MKTPRENRDDVREEVLTIPMNKEEKVIIQKAADDMGISMSAFARMAIKSFVNKG